MNAMSATKTLLALFALGLLVGPAMAQHTCNASTAAQFQDCLDQAATGAGAGQDSVITLAAGTFSINDNGGLPFSYVIDAACNSGAAANSLTITGNGAGSTILDGASTNQVLHIRHRNFDRTCYNPPGTEVANDNDDSGATVSVQGVTVQNGRVVQVPERRMSSSGCNYDDGSGDAGGMALLVGKAEVMVADSEFLNNRGSEGGGAKIHKSCGSSGVSFLDSHVMGNGTIEVPALSFWINLDTCDTFTSDPGGNSQERTLSARSPDSGGGVKISARDGLVLFERNMLIGNETNIELFEGNNWGFDGGGLSGKGIFGLGEPGGLNAPSCPNSDSPWAVEVDYDPAWQNDFVENETGGTGTIMVGGSIWQIADNRFENNATNYGDGGGAHLWGNMTVERNEFINNQSNIRADGGCCGSGDGGGLHIFTRDNFEVPILTRNLFQGNDADGEGGGLQLRSPRGRVDVTASVFSSNSSSGDVLFSTERHVSQGGGGGAFLYTDDGEINLINNSVCANVAVAGPQDRSVGHGGGVVVYAQLSDDEHGTTTGGPFDLPAVANIYNNIIWGNSADGLGEDLFIEDLHAGSNNSYYHSGGTIVDDEGSLIRLFSNNYGDIYHLCEDDPDCTADLEQGSNTSMDPVFVNIDECRLDPSSPLVDIVGTTAPTNGSQPTVDYDGNPINPSSPILGAIGVGLGLPIMDPFPVPIFSLPGMLFLTVLMLLATILVRRSRRMVR